MANNRMYLYHKASGISCFLGKRMCEGWYKAPEANFLEKFYDECYMDSDPYYMDDF